MRHVLLIGAGLEASGSVAGALTAAGCTFERAAGDADALRWLRRQAFDVAITSPTTSIEEDLALLEEMRRIRPGVKTILLAPSAAPEDVIAAVRAQAYACFSAPFQAEEIAEMAVRATADAEWRKDIEVLAAHRNWVSLRANCCRLTAERLLQFLGELRTEVRQPDREELLLAVREILLNAMEHGAGFDPEQVVEVAAVRTARAIVFYVRDPGAGFRSDAIPHAAVSNPPEEPAAHMQLRLEQGMRPGGYGILLVRKVVDELIYSEVGNEVLMIKHAA